MLMNPRKAAPPVAAVEMPSDATRCMPDPTCVPRISFIEDKVPGMQIGRSYRTPLSIQFGLDWNHPTTGLKARKLWFRHFSPYRPL
ncbi:hypothetical protein A0H81_13712 [Grifola frondosa]|uniref:Uncharacterized protein n=1 Tax=Grifola frondosa TaxID=5627 RepID=A0A1C7LNF8_GRIFR|nr:hypothetical protein A0H81_13712 [Grifola frondosa]